MSTIERVISTPAAPPKPAWSHLIGAVEHLACTTSLDDVIDVVRSTARKIAQADGITFVLRDGDRCYYVAEDAISPLWQGQRFPLKACISGWCMLTGETAVISDIYADDCIPHDAYRPTFVSSLVMTPVAGNPSPAAIGAYWSTYRKPSQEIVDLLAALARSTGIAIANVQLKSSLRESEARCARYIEALPAAIYATDASGNVTYFNQAAIDLLGFRLDPLAPSWRPRWKLFAPDGSPIADEQTPMAVTLREQRPVHGIEAIAERADGTRVPILPFPTPLHDERGRMTGTINMFVDITERKSAESAMRTLLDELNHRVKNNLQMLGSLLSLSQREAVSPDGRHAIGQARARVGAMAAVQRTLYISDATTHIEGCALLEAVCKSAGAFGEADIDCVADEIVVSNDCAMPLALIVNELVTNALKHAATGGHAPRVDVSLRQASDNMTLTVSDNGPGFERRQTGRRASGLELVDALARQLRGSFIVHLGPGANCVVRFPHRARSHEAE